MLRKKKPKKTSPTLEFMRKTREEEWKKIQSDEVGFRKIEKNESKEDI